MMDLSDVPQSKNKAPRMRERENRKRFMLYPEDALKGYWDLTMSVALILTCSLTPYSIAFSTD